jgi:hypothetical protein
MTERLRAAYHEASHAAAALTFAIPILSVSIDADRPHLLRGRYKPPPEIGLDCLVTMCLAGPVGEQYFCGAINDDADEIDYQMARQYLSRRFDPLQVEAEIVRLRAAADRLVCSESHRISVIASALLRHGSLNAE